MGAAWDGGRCRPADLRGRRGRGLPGRLALLLPRAPGRGRSARPAAILYEAEQLLDGALVLPALLLRRQCGRAAVRYQLPLLVAPLLQLLLAEPTQSSAQADGLGNMSQEVQLEPSLAHISVSA